MGVWRDEYVGATSFGVDKAERRPMVAPLYDEVVPFTATLCHSAVPLSLSSLLWMRIRADAFSWDWGRRRSFYRDGLREAEEKEQFGINMARPVVDHYKLEL